jgi:hypothetical protein
MRLGFLFTDMTERWKEGGFVDADGLTKYILHSGDIRDMTRNHLAWCR